MKGLASLISATSAWVKANKTEEQQVGELVTSVWGADGEVPDLGSRPVVQRSTLGGGTGGARTVDPAKRAKSG
jgi:hypothetical protein